MSSIIQKLSFSVRSKLTFPVLVVYYTEKGHILSLIMRSTYLAVYILFSLLYVTKWTNGSKLCDQEDQDKLECFSCANTADAPTSKCSNDTSELYSNWIETGLSKSNDGKKNDTRYLKFQCSVKRFILINKAIISNLNS